VKGRRWVASVCAVVMPLILLACSSERSPIASTALVERTTITDRTSSQANHLQLPQLLGLYRRTQVSVLADSYANVFILTAALTAIAAVGALFLRSGPAPHADSGAAVTIEPSA
jgi:hypothetical protein